MKSGRKNGGELLFIALGAIALGVFNLVIQRFIDGSLCIVGGIGALIIWKMRRY